MAKIGSNHLKFSKTLRISMLFTYFQPFSAGSTGSTGSMNYAPGTGYRGVSKNFCEGIKTGMILPWNDMNQNKTKIVTHFPHPMLEDKTGLHFSRIIPGGAVGTDLMHKYMFQNSKNHKNNQNPESQVGQFGFHGFAGHTQGFPTTSQFPCNVTFYRVVLQKYHGKILAIFVDG